MELREIIKSLIQWDHIRPYYFSVKSYLNLTRRLDTPIVFKFLDLHHDDLVLDLCCGSALQARGIARRASQVIGVDLEMGSIKFGHYLSKSMKIANIQLLVGDARCLPFKNGIFGKVICNHSLEHIIDDMKVVEEISRVSRKGAIFVLNVPHEDRLEKSWMLKKIFKLPKVIKRLILSKYCLFSDIDLHNTTNFQALVKSLKESLLHFHIYSLNQLCSLLFKGNFKILKVKYYEKKFGRLAQDIRYTFRLGRSPLMVPFLYILSLPDILLDDKIEGAGMIVKTIKS